MTDPYATLAAFYDLDHDPVTDDIEMYAQFAARGDGSVLEIGTGTGRIAQALADRGFRVTGLDVSETMIALALARTGATDRRPTYYVQSVEEWTSTDRYSLVIFSLDTFAHLTDTDRQVAALRVVRQALAPRGVIVFDLSAPDLATWHDENDVVIVAWTRETEAGTVQKLFARSVDERDQIQHVRFWYDRFSPGGVVQRWFAEIALRYFTIGELRLVLQRADLDLVAVYGDYDLAPFGDGCPRLIGVAQRARRPRRQAS